MKVVEKHQLWLRISHWLNVPLLLLMMWSGILIYWANDIYWPFFSKPIYDFFNIGGRLAEGIYTHFLIAWLLIFNGLIYLIWLFASGHWRELFPDRSTPSLLVPTLLHDLGLRKEPTPKAKFNAIQRIVYTGVILMAILEILTGFAIYKPVQLSWLTWSFGGYEGARLIHFIVTILFGTFILVHLIQVIRAGWNGFRAMVAGFEVEHDE